MTKRIFVAIMFSLVLVGYSQAQVTGKTIKWKVESGMDVSKGAPTSQYGYVVTYQDKILFLPPANALAQIIQSFTIKNTTSTWTDLDKDGDAVFQVMDGDRKGTLSIKRINGKLWITLNVFSLNEKTLLDFKCAGYEIIPQK
jgi:hypothetical protein